MFIHKAKLTLLALVPACLAVMAAGHRAAAEATVKEAFSYAGTVNDDKGRPVAGVEVVATHRDVQGHGYGYIATTETDAQGRFAIERPVALSGATPSAVADETIRLEFNHKEHAYARLEDIQVLSREQATKLSVRLRAGRSVEGRLLDGEHRPVKGALVDIKFGENVELRRATVSDADGRFTLHGVPALNGAISVLTTDLGQPMLTATQKVNEAQTGTGDIPLAAIKLPDNATVHELLGMKLVDVDADLQAAFHLSQAGGVLILDPGVNSGRLKIGELQRGDRFFVVGDDSLKDFDDFKTRLKAAVKSGRKGVRVVYSFARADFAGTNTQFLELSADDVAELTR